MCYNTHMKAKRIFSGIQPSGNLHIGNYLGAIKQWVNLQDTSKEYEMFFCIVDLHAITVPQDPQALRKNIRELAALYIASGIDPDVSKMFVQSENSDHAYLSWIFDCITPMGWMERMTQYKDKSAKQGERTSVGLFNYPVLMAADILLYEPDLVPVGDDQKQHIELTRDIAEKFNTKYAPTFKLPQIFNQPQTARVMSLQNPLAKMSKSTIDPSGTIGMLDSTDEIVKKIKRAVTDSGTDIVSGTDKPAMTNLLGIYSGFSGMSVKEIEKKYEGATYSVFKEDLAQVVTESLGNIQKSYAEIRTNETVLDRILNDGLRHATVISNKKVEAVKKLMGLARS